MKKEINYLYYFIMIFCLLQNVSCAEKKQSFSINDDIFFSIKKYDFKRFKELVKDYDINALDENKRTFLIEAAFCNSREVAYFLINNNANIDLQDKEGNTALVLSLEKGNDEIVESLLKKGADIKINPNNKSLFLFACEIGNIEVLKLLVEKGINFRDKDKEGRNGFMRAIIYDRNIEFLEYLIKIGIDINAKDNKGYTALMMCVYTDDTMEYVDFLIEKGVDVNIVNNENMTALDIALKYEDTGSDYTNVYIINVLKEAGAKRAKEL